MKVMKVFCIVLARGGSKQIKKKNIIKLNNKPMLYYTIKEALRSKLIHETWVSSDSDEILEYSKKIGANTIKRPLKYSKDNSSSESSWIHAVRYLKMIGKQIDVVVAPQVTSPKRPEKIFDNAIKYFKINKFDSLMSVNEINQPNTWVKSKNSKILKKKNHNSYKTRQSLEKTYNENGSFYIFKASEFLVKKNRLFKKIGMFKMNKKYGFEVDDIEDLLILKKIFKI